LCGYPLPRIKAINGKFNLNNVRKYWQPTFVIDYYDLSGINTFTTQHPSLNGMSGGPVFGVEGKVYGMDIKTYIRKIDIPNNEPHLIRNGVVVSLAELTKAFKQI